MVDLVDDDNIAETMIASKIIYDFSDKISLAPSYVYNVDNDGNNLSYFMLEGGFQFTKMKYGYFNYDIRLNPYFITNLSGKNRLYTKNIFGLSLKIFFN